MSFKNGFEKYLFMSDPIGKADIIISGKRYKDVDLYGYKTYRSIFPSDFTDTSIEDLPKMAKVVYRGNKYSARKYGNPNNQRPTYDFEVQNKL